jgi:hypothetical protein
MAAKEIAIKDSRVLYVFRCAVYFADTEKEMKNKNSGIRR